MNDVSEKAGKPKMKTVFMALDREPISESADERVSWNEIEPFWQRNRSRGNKERYRADCRDTLSLSADGK